MEKYSKAVSEMYSQFKQEEDHPLEKYVGRLATCDGEKVEVVGYSHDRWTGGPLLIVEAPQGGSGWSHLIPCDVIFKECEYYRYVSINDLID